MKICYFTTVLECPYYPKAHFTEIKYTEFLIKLLTTLNQYGIGNEIQIKPFPLKKAINVVEKIIKKFNLSNLNLLPNNYNVMKFADSYDLILLDDLSTPIIEFALKKVNIMIIVSEDWVLFIKEAIEYLNNRCIVCDSEEDFYLMVNNILSKKIDLNTDNLKKKLTDSSFITNYAKFSNAKSDIMKFINKLIL